jgi:GTP-binding protein
MIRIKKSEFIKSIGKLEDRPKPFLPEYAFAGRSNVGKSSLINCLLNRQNIARVSKSPGKTRSINYIKVNNEFYVVDLPGYGYAKVSHSEKKRWQAMIEMYMESNKQLNILFTLIDSKVGMKTNDLELLEYLHFHNIYFEIILTKSDKIGLHAQSERVNEIVKELNWTSSQRIHLFSSKKRNGIDSVLGAIDQDLSG